MTTVMGIDAAAGGWLAVWLDEGAFGGSALRRSVAEVLALRPDAAVIATDIPIGLPSGSLRDADAAARTFVGGRRASSVFDVPPEEVLRAPSHAEANVIARRLLGQAISIQTYGLRERIFEVAGIAASDRRIVEVHPEVSFRAIADAPLRYSKSTWSGVLERMDLLLAAGLDPPMALDGGDRAGPDDVLDAAIAAWSARRVHEGRSATLPDIPPTDPARGGVIHY